MKFLISRSQTVCFLTTCYLSLSPPNPPLPSPRRRPNLVSYTDCLIIGFEQTVQTAA